MPTLDWIGKKAVLNHHRQVPYRLLRCDRELSEFGRATVLAEAQTADKS
ncbi:MAG: hypothetical protein GXY55_15650 [Phycisphaerae bacterium]|nr:hypothetical protein [Phycisphaerae bacterium]